MVTSPMCEISKIPASFRTARCSSVMLVYCTGISQPPNSISFPPSFWCAAKRGVRFSMLLPPLLRFHLCLGRAQFEDHAFSEFNKGRGTARVKNRFAQIADVRFEPACVDA